jgi:hypothetical protein
MPRRRIFAEESPAVIQRFQRSYRRWINPNRRLSEDDARQIFGIAGDISRCFPLVSLHSFHFLVVYCRVVCRETIRARKQRGPGLIDPRLIPACASSIAELLAWVCQARASACSERARLAAVASVQLAWMLVRRVPPTAECSPQ